MLKFYNTLTRKIEPFKPFDEKNVKMYCCGITPYNFAHIGNLKKYVGDDMIVRSLRFLGYKVNHVTNVTDIDDKTLRDSQKIGESLKDFTEKYTNYFYEDSDKLFITRPDHITPISTIIPEMVFMINVLFKKGFAYLAEDGSIYYSIKKFKKYGELANLDFSGMKTSVRVNNDEYSKEEAADFALWKSYDEKEDGENFWIGEFILENGEKVEIKGRPGWHIECSACNMKHFGQQIDIHTGGIDNLFPHHQNEVAQTEGCTGKQFSKYWVHHGHLMVNGKKMAKSANNFFTLRDLEEKYSHINKNVFFRSLRFLFLNGKYTDSIDLSFDKLEQGINTIKSLDNFLKNLDNFIKNSGNISKTRKEFSQNLQIVLADFIEAVEDNFNMPEAFCVFFDFISFIKKELQSEYFSLSEANSAKEFLKTFNEIFVILNFDILEKTEEIPEEIIILAEERIKAKNEKNFELADELRKQILEKGFVVKDLKDEFKIEKV